MTRRILLVVHTGRDDARVAAAETADRLARAGVDVLLLAEEAGALDVPAAHVVDADAWPDVSAGVELVIVFGGDGTLLRAAELARPHGLALLGVNLGRVGFLAEAERAGLAGVVDRVIGGDYGVSERLTLDVTVTSQDGVVERAWALNEASVERAQRQGLLDVVVAVDGRPLSRWGGDAVLVATPTGSTAYAFSAGGPVVWPDLDAFLVVPVAVHALFNRPLVVAPDAVVRIDIVDGDGPAGLLVCDGRRPLELPRAAQLEFRRGAAPVRLARLADSPFTDRLVRKFALPVQGWRGDDTG